MLPRIPARPANSQQSPLNTGCRWPSTSITSPVPPSTRIFASKLNMEREIVGERGCAAAAELCTCRGWAAPWCARYGMHAEAQLGVRLLLDGLCLCRCLAAAQQHSPSRPLHAQPELSACSSQPCHAQPVPQLGASTCMSGCRDAASVLQIVCSLAFVPLQRSICVFTGYLHTR